MAFLKDFRHAISVLKKQGLVEDVDARSAYPTWKRGGKKLSTLVEHYDAVLSGKATAVEVPDKVLRKYRAIGRETANGRVIQPHGLDETAYYEAKTESIVIRHKSGIERVQLPIPLHNVEQWARDVQKNKKQINRLKRGDEGFGFRYFGNNGSEIFGDIGLFIDFITKYESFNNQNKYLKGADFYENLEILRLNRAAMNQWETPSERRHERNKEYSRKVSRKFRKRLKKKPEWIQDEYRNATADRMRLYRARMTKTEKAKYNADARKRRKKNARKRRGRK